ALLWTRMGGGDEATALLVILMTTATSWLATTAWLVLGTGVAVRTERLMLDLILVLVVPVALGQLSRSFGPRARTASRSRRPVAVLAQLLVFSIIVKATAEVSGELRARTASAAVLPLLWTAALCVGTHLAALAGGLWTSRGLGFDRPSQVAV